jgi:hypothetical protein
MRISVLADFWIQSSIWPVAFERGRLGKRATAAFSAQRMTAALARLPRRTTMRAGSFSSGITAFEATSPSSLTAFSAILRLASAPDGASPSWTSSLGRRMASARAIRRGRPGRRRRRRLLPRLPKRPFAGTCAPSFRRRGAASSAEWKSATMARANCFFASIGCRLPEATWARRCVDFRLPEVGEQGPVLPHQLVGDGHQLAVHLLRRLVDADGVAERFGHLLHAVEAFEDRVHQDDLRLLAVLALQFAPAEQVEPLVGATRARRRTRARPSRRPASAGREIRAGRWAARPGSACGIRRAPASARR